MATMVISELKAISCISLGSVLIWLSGQVMATAPVETEWGRADTDGDGVSEYIFVVDHSTYYSVKIVEPNGAARYATFFDYQPFPYGQDSIEIVAAADLNASSGSELVVLGIDKPTPTSAGTASVWIVEDDGSPPVSHTSMYSHAVDGGSGFYSKSEDFGYQLNGTGGEEVVYLHADATSPYNAGAQVVVIDYTNDSYWNVLLETASLQLVGVEDLKGVEDLDGMGGEEVIAFFGVGSEIHLAVLDYTVQEAQIFDFPSDTGKYLGARDTNGAPGKELLVTYPGPAPKNVGVVDWRQKVSRRYNRSPDVVDFVGFGKIDYSDGEEVVIKRAAQSSSFNHVDIIHDANPVDPIQEYGSFSNISNVTITNVDGDSQKEVIVRYNHGASTATIDETQHSALEACFAVNGNSSSQVTVCHFKRANFNGSCSVGDNLEYKFVFGNGEETDWSTNPIASLIYGAGMNVTAMVHVRDPSAQSDSATKEIEVVTWCPRPPSGRITPYMPAQPPVNNQ